MKMSLMLSTVCVSVVALVFSCSVSQAVPILDQEYAPPPDTVLSENLGAHAVYQTFSVGLSGLLTQADVYLGQGEFEGIDVDFRVHDTFGTGVPTGPGSLPDPILSSLVIDDADIPEDKGWVSIPLSSEGLRVSTGDVLAFELLAQVPSSTPDVHHWFGSSGNPYSLGGAFIGYNNVWGYQVEEVGDGDVDLGFRTYVDPDAPPIPEPTSMILMVIGLLGLCLFSRLRTLVS